MKIFIVGGTFDDNGGKPSGLINKISDAFLSLSVNVILHNGGYYSNLNDIMHSVKEEDVIFWMVNVPNDKDKERDLKALYPKKYLIMSKRNNDEYTFSEMINRALSQKANLMLEFKNDDKGFIMRVFDPLATVWCDYTNDVKTIVTALKNRLDFIMNITRSGSIQLDGEVDTPNEEHFFGLIKEYAEVFHELVNPDKTVTRFLGNSSFRCQRGFPSFRNDNKIFVSQRNIDKRYIGKDGFVATKLEDDKVYYWGNKKPSVDTPIQLRLYAALPNINYMIHAHVYLKNAEYTQNAVPCGALEEVEEVLSKIKDKNIDYFEINLIGHGCLVFANNTDQIKDINYESRPSPEIIK
jgi:hypothetical protein